jgi:glutathione S-transferase
MIKHYTRKNSGSAATEAQLAVCNAPYEQIEVERNPDGSLPAWFLNVSSRGEVPALLLPDGTLLTESAAIMMHVADCFPAAGLAPVTHRRTFPLM